MIRMFLVFALLFAAFWLGIAGIRALTGWERLELTKLALYSIVCAGLATAVLITIVILF